MPALGHPDIALAYLRHLERGDIAGALLLFTDDATARVPGYPEMSKAQLQQYLTGAYQVFVTNSLTFRPAGVTAEGDRVALEVESSAMLKNGLPYTNRYHFLFVFRGELIRQMRAYTDGALAAALA